jgi:glyoxylase-like metal-dependent hydrolase (beta-lactamase superfamily II)
MLVERFESALWQTASLLLVDGGEAVVVDPCISREEVSRISARAAELGARVTAVLATHADWDHVCGIAAFPEAEAAMGERTAELVASEAHALRVAELAAQNGVEVAGPPRADRLLEAGRAHRVGPFVVETLALPGHTPDGTAFRVRALDLLAVGDHLSSIEFPYVMSTADYRSTLAGLIELLRRDPPGRVVCGHGPEHSPADALAVAEADLAYLRRLHDAVEGALAAGAAPEDARAAGTAVEPPRPGGDEEMRASNAAAQLAELLTGGTRGV